MTKSLGRTYSLLDFSGREMHYWPGNLPRRRAAPCRVGVASPGGTLYVRCYRALHPLVLVFQEDATCRPRRLLLFSPFAIPRPTDPLLPPAPRPPAVEPLRLHCIVLEGTPGETSPHVRKVTARPLLFLQTAVVAVREREHEKF